MKLLINIEDETPAGYTVRGYIGLTERGYSCAKLIFYGKDSSNQGVLVRDVYLIRSQHGTWSGRASGHDANKLAHTIGFEERLCDEWYTKAATNLVAGDA